MYSGEFQSLAQDGLDPKGSSFLRAHNGSTAHKDGKGDGGSWYFDSTTTSAGQRLRSETFWVGEVVDGFLAFALYESGAYTTPHEINFYSSAGEQFSIEIANTGFISLVRDSTTLATSTKAIAWNKFNWISVEYRCHDSTGYCRVNVNGELFVEVTGADTRNQATTPGWSYFEFPVRSGGRTDDIILDVPHLEYDTGTSGVPAVGDTVTDGTTGATARITAVFGDATSGFLVLDNWDGTAYGNNNIITSPGFSAQVYAPNAAYISGLGPNSTGPITEQVLTLNVPTSDVVANLTRSTGSNNYETVDDVGGSSSETDYNEATAVSQDDLYGMGNLAFSPDTVYAVQAVAWVNASGAISTARLNLNQSSDDYKDNHNVGASFQRIADIWDVDPDGSQWTEALVNSVRAGIDFN